MFDCRQYIEGRNLSTSQDDTTISRFAFQNHDLKWKEDEEVMWRRIFYVGT
jgi:hypothetical protein